MARGRQQDELQDITLLGNQDNTYSFNYRPDVSESFDNKHQGCDYFVKSNCPEFTSLYPTTEQPDFATICTSYIPNVEVAEPKSLKLYLFGFRNRGDSHEDCMNIVMNDLIEFIGPYYIEIWDKFTPRGGTSTDPYTNYGRSNSKYEQMTEHRLMNYDLYPEKTDNR